MLYPLFGLQALFLFKSSLYLFTQHFQGEVSIAMVLVSVTKGPGCSGKNKRVLATALLLPPYRHWKQQADLLLRMLQNLGAEIS